MSKENHPAWIPPPGSYRLSIDDVLLEMMSRTRSPRIAEDRAGNSDVLRTYGPFALARIHLDNAVFSAIDPHDEKGWVAGKIKLLEDIDTAAEILMAITGYPYQSYKISPLPRLRTY
jgi:hypothetical protein